MTTELDVRRNVEFRVSPRYIFKPFSKPGIIFDSKDNLELPKDDIQTSVLIYEDRVKGYFFDQARELLGSSSLNNEDSGRFSAYTVLMIAISQIEGVQQYREGESSAPDRNRGIPPRSREFFVRGMTRIFNIESKDKGRLEDLYTAARCGLFHDGFTKGLVYLALDFDNPKYQEALKIERWEYNSDKIRFGINSKLFLAEVERDFDQYIINLKDQSNSGFDNLRNKFKIFWTKVWKESKELLALAESDRKDLQM
jgi:hypothetical protein